MCTIPKFIFLFLHLLASVTLQLKTTGPPYLLSNTTSLTLPSTTSFSNDLVRAGYLVPGTQTFVDVLLLTDYPLPAVDVEVVLSAIEVQLAHHITQRGDGPLVHGDNPYEYGVPGCFFSAKSISPNSLTYGVLKDAMQGLQYLLVSQSRFFVGYFDISKGSAEGTKLGDGCLENHDDSGASTLKRREQRYC